MSGVSFSVATVASLILCLLAIVYNIVVNGLAVPSRWNRKDLLLTYGFYGCVMGLGIAFSAVMKKRSSAETPAAPENDVREETA